MMRLMKPEGQTIKPQDIFCFITLSQTLEDKIFTQDLNNQSGSTCLTKSI